VDHPDRKPGPGMLKRAAAELNLDLAGSWMVGDMISDVLAGKNAGCKSILLRGGEPLSSAERTAGGTFDEVDGLQAAGQIIKGGRAAAR